MYCMETTEEQFRMLSRHLLETVPSLIGKQPDQAKPWYAGEQGCG
jgi:hypothetical protein